MRRFYGLGSALIHWDPCPYQKRKVWAHGWAARTVDTEARWTYEDASKVGVMLSHVKGR